MSLNGRDAKRGDKAVLKSGDELTFSGSKQFAYVSFRKRDACFHFHLILPGVLLLACCVDLVVGPCLPSSVSGESFGISLVDVRLYA